MNSAPLDELIQEHIDHLLKSWHMWSSVERHGQGYPGTAAGCAMYRASRQHDMENGAIDHATDMLQAQAVDGVIRKMPDPHRSALHFEARNLCSSRVWMSARIDLSEAERVVREARQMFWARIVSEGVA